MPRSKPALCAERGFSLIELIAVIIILGIVAAVVGPRFADRSAFSARAYADELASAIRRTQLSALSSGCAASLNITTTGYVAQQRAAAAALPPCAASGAWSVSILNGDGSALAGALPPGVSYAPAVRITFDAQGRLSGAPPTLQVGMWTLSIDPYSGLVSVL